MTATETKWAARVAEWRASEQTAPAFCEGKDFTAGGLRYWSSQLRRRDVEKGRGRPMRMARVIRSRQVGATDTQVTRATDALLVVEVGGARVAIRRGFDPEVLRAVVDTLGGSR